MNSKLLATEKHPPKDLFTKAVFSPGLQRLLRPYLGGDALTLAELCRDLATKQAPLSDDEVIVMLLQKYLDRGLGRSKQKAG